MATIRREANLYVTTWSHKYRHFVPGATKSLFVSGVHLICLWSKDTRLAKSQILVTAGANGHYTHGNAFAPGITKSLFASGVHHSCVWSEDTRLTKSQILVTAGANGHYTHGNAFISLSDREYILYVPNT